MSDDEVKNEEVEAEETEDEDAGKSVDFASLIDEDEPAEPADGSNPDEVAPATANRKVDLDGDDSGWVYADESEEEEEEDSYEDSHEA